MKIGIICPSEIAYRRFLPALKSSGCFEFAGVGVNTPIERYGEYLPEPETVEEMLIRGRTKAERMISEFEGRIYPSFAEILSDPELDAMYIPLPPAQHYSRVMDALKNGKHVLVEKPAGLNRDEANHMVREASARGLALHENYMFIYHRQLDEICRIVKSGELGEVRLYRISFGFPRRAANDFRYNKALGGGALLDAGGYTIRCATYLLGSSARIVYAQANYLNEFEVDMFGSGALVNADGVTAQIAFGMDNEYKCELEIWGSKGSLHTGRILTAPAGFVPTAEVIKGGEKTTVNLPADDAFRNSIAQFKTCIEDDTAREENYRSILTQANLLTDFAEMAGVR